MWLNGQEELRIGARLLLVEVEWGLAAFKV